MQRKTLQKLNLLPAITQPKLERETLSSIPIQDTININCEAIFYLLYIISAIQLDVFQIGVVRADTISFQFIYLFCI